MGNGRRPLALLAVLLLLGCAQQEVEDAPPPDPAAASTVAVAPPAPPAAPAVTPTPAARDPYDEVPLDHLPPLEQVAPGPQRLLETARRALLQGRAELEQKQFALATEDFDVAAEALRQARRDTPDGPTATEIDALLAQFKRELPGSPADVTPLIDQVARLRGPIQLGSPAAAPAPAPDATAPPAAEAAPTPPPAPTAAPAEPVQRM